MNTKETRQIRLRLRVSHRQLDHWRGAPVEPYLTHTEEQWLSPGQIVPADIAITPMGMFWHAGQQLRVIIAGHGLATQSFPGIVDRELRNKGKHIIHTGGQYNSHLLIPVITR